MEQVKLAIHVVPDDRGTDILKHLSDFDFRKTGSNFSTSDVIRVNRVEDRYSILYKDSEFIKLEAIKAIDYIIHLFTSKLPGKQIIVELEYHFELDDGIELFDDDIGDLLAEMDDILIEIGNNTSIVVYERTDSMDDVIETLKESDDDDDEDDEEEWDDEDFDPFDLGNFVNMIAQEGSRSKKKRNKKVKKSYGESLVIHETKNPKRCYDRHGVLVCSKKGALKHDQKMIKEFLKDFIPGNAEWKKDFRRDLQKRWMQMYVISKKQLKQLQKKHVKSKSKKRRGIDTEKALDFTRRVFNVPATSSAWNDPNR